MKVATGVAALDRGDGRLFIVLGVFDGLHTGHAYLLEALVREAAARAARPTVITFDHHPDEVITGTAPPLLLDPAERLERLAAAGVSLTVVHHFDDATRRTPYDAFVRSIAERVELAGFLMTPESAFGHEREGTPATLAELGRELGYDVAVVPTFELDGQPVRSTDIRAAIGRGDLAAAAALLGRPYSIVGDVRGDGRLRAPMPVALPPVGTYSAVIDEQPGRAVVEPSGGLWLEPRPAGGRRRRVTFEGPAGPREPPTAASRTS